MATWDALPPEMKDSVFAALTLLDLGRAAPTSREFRAAYQARLAAAHAAVVQKGTSYYGEAFLEAHSTVILRLFWGLDLFSGGTYGGQRRHGFHILKDGTLKHGHPPEGLFLRSSLVFERILIRPTPIIITDGNKEVDHLGDMRPHCFRTVPPIGFCRHSFFRLVCYPAGEYMCVHMLCRISECEAAAGALAVMCKHIKAHCGGPATQQGQLLKLAVQLEIGVNGYRSRSDLLSEAQGEAIAAALLPLFPLIQVLKFLYLPPEMKVLECASLGKLQDIIQGTPKWKA